MHTELFELKKNRDPQAYISETVLHQKLINSFLLNVAFYKYIIQLSTKPLALQQEGS